MTAKAVMVLGTTSGAGKSWVATALCRWYARQGLSVVPFKAQNMSNNARVVPGLQGRSGEIGSAQYFQALAAGAVPDVRMNPVLLKPESDTTSQVVVLGDARADLGRVPWRERSELLWPHAREALHSLMTRSDVVVIEGAGSPAEINLHSSDFVNMRTALEARAACLLVTDIDRGGAFAHLYGTHQLLLAQERALLKGFVLNRFRGDATLLAPGPQQLQAMTGVPTLAVLPMWRGHGLPEEDGVFDARPSGAQNGRRIAVIAYPRVSNLDEFQPLRGMANVRLTWARQPSDLEGADLIILPGSKNTSADLSWVREQGLDLGIASHAAAGKPLLGICGGLQMLGEEMRDPHGVDGTAVGLGLLGLVTVFERDKLLLCTRACFESTDGTWAALAGVRLDGYEIRHGRTHCSRSQPQPRVALRNATGQPIGWQAGSVLGVSLHGLFESPDLLSALLGIRAEPLIGVFDGLADFVDRHFAAGALARLIEE